MLLKRCEERYHNIGKETSIDEAFEDQEPIADMVVESYSQRHEDTSIDQKYANKQIPATLVLVVRKDYARGIL